MGWGEVVRWGVHHGVGCAVCRLTVVSSCMSVRHPMSLRDTNRPRYK